MTNDMIAMASNWEERLRTQKDEKKDHPQVWGKSFPQLVTLTVREKNLNPKGMITYKRPTTIGQFHTNYNHPLAPGPVGDLAKYFFQGGPKVVKFGFYPSKLKK